MGGRSHLSHILPLPSGRLGRYQIILLGDRGTCVCEQLAQGCYLAVDRLAVEAATSGSLVRHARLPSHMYLSLIACNVLVCINCLECKQFVMLNPLYQAVLFNEFYIIVVYICNI